MSLTLVHIVFIVVATLTTFGFGFWSINEYMTSGGFGDLALGIGSFAAGIVLIWYGNKFFRKLKDLKSMRSS